MEFPNRGPGSSENDGGSASAGGAIRHIVMWKVRGDSEAERDAAIALVKTGFEGLRESIPGLLRLEIGVDISRADYACDLVLVSDFDDAASLASYGVHPAHLAVRDALAGIRIERHQVDYTIAA